MNEILKSEGASAAFAKIYRENIISSAMVSSETYNYEIFRDKIHSGDILLCSGTSIFSKLIQRFTGSPWSHVGFILRISQIDRIMVLESVESIGVRSVPLSSYIINYNGSGRPYPGEISIMRHDDFSPHMLHDLSRKAIDLLGHPYDSSEISRIAARIAFTDAEETACRIPKGDNDFICSEYVYECFKSVGIIIQHDCRGFIAPKDFANDKKIKLVAEF
jgi:hypothetical protein